jgi:hypothetical protein
MRETLNLEDVFPKSGVPKHTYVQPIEYADLMVALRNRKMPVIVEGPSGIGKTTLLRKTFDDLGVSPLFLRARKDGDWPAIGSLQNLKFKGNSPRGTVVIDDFHLLSEKLKRRIADYIRGLADEDAPQKKVIILGINKAGQALIDLRPDIHGRIETFSLKTSSDEKIAELLRLGSECLNVTFADVDRMVHESQGSFHLAQHIAYQACIKQSITKTQDQLTVVTTTVEQIRDGILDSLATRWFALARTFARGTVFNPDGRKPYLWLLYWFAKSNDWTLDVRRTIEEHPEHKQSLTAVTNPTNKRLENFLSDRNNGLDAFLHYDPVSQHLAIEDPKAFYYLKHLNFRKFARECGFSNREFVRKYDFALSFAGKERPLAELLFERLTRRQLNVFFDQNEEARLLGEKIEEYLRPIYESDAEYVVPFLSPEYPNRVWTKFESDIFKARFGEKRVLPVVVDDYKPDQFGSVYNVGYCTIERAGDIDAQIEKIADLMASKLQL